MRICAVCGDSKFSKYLYKNHLTTPSLKPKCSSLHFIILSDVMSVGMVFTIEELNWSLGLEGRVVSFPHTL
jgi:hypothetical protein